MWTSFSFWIRTREKSNMSKQTLQKVIPSGSFAHSANCEDLIYIMIIIYWFHNPMVTFINWFWATFVCIYTPKVDFASYVFIQAWFFYWYFIFTLLNFIESMHRVWHRYGNTHGDQVTGTTGRGMVLVFGTLWHTMYPYHHIMGILQVCYNKFYCFKTCFFSYLIIVFLSEVIVSHCDATKYGTASRMCILASYCPLFTPPPIPSTM